MATVQEGFTDLPVSKPRRSPTAAPRLSTPVLRRSKIDLEDRFQGLTLTVPPRGSAIVTSPFRLHSDPPCAPTSGTDPNLMRVDQLVGRNQSSATFHTVPQLVFAVWPPLFCAVSAFSRADAPEVSHCVFLQLFVGLCVVRCGTGRASVPLFLQPSSYSAR